MSHHAYPDTRVVRTRSLLHAAMLELLEGMPYSAVSVTDITKKAGVNRVTFYSHYSSKADLLEEIMEEKFSQYFSIVEYIKPLKDIDQLIAGLEVYFRKSLQHISQNVKFYRLLFSGVLPDYKDRFEKRFQDRLKQLMLKAGANAGADARVDFDFYVEWNVGGTIQTIRKWLDNGMNPPQEQFIEQMLLISAVSSKLFGVRGEELP